MRSYGGFPGGSGGMKSVCNVGDPVSIPGSGRSPGEGNGNPLQHSCLGNPMDRGAWWATVHGVTKSQKQLKQLRWGYTHIITHTHSAHRHPHTQSFPHNPPTFTCAVIPTYSPSPTSNHTLTTHSCSCNYTHTPSCLQSCTESHAYAWCENPRISELGLDSQVLISSLPSHH